MVRRVLRVVALVAAVAVAVGAGTMVRHQLSGSDPVDVARAATKAFATGDCAALRRLSAVPAAIDCAAVHGVRDAYRAEGLKPETFRYQVVSRDDRTASVRISYRTRGKPAEEIVELERHDDTWKILPVPLVG